jgi:hypothetical protein
MLVDMVRRARSKGRAAGPSPVSSRLALWMRRRGGGASRRTLAGPTGRTLVDEVAGRRCRREGPWPGRGGGRRQFPGQTVPVARTLRRPTAKDRMADKGARFLSQGRRAGSRPANARRSIPGRIAPVTTSPRAPMTPGWMLMYEVA